MFPGKRAVSTCLALLSAALLIGCGKNEHANLIGTGNTGDTRPLRVSGVLVNGATVGSLHLTIDPVNAAPPLRGAAVRHPVQGFCVFEGQDTIPLEGLYDPETGSMAVSDSAWILSGAVATVNGVQTIDGNWIGPNAVAGWFGANIETAQRETGGYSGYYDGGGGGNMALLLADGTLRGRWYPNSGNGPLHIFGTLVSGTTTRTVGLGSPDVIFSASGTLTVSTQEMQGTWFQRNPDVDGSWRATRVP